jgi:hypothetical protein
MTQDPILPLHPVLREYGISLFQQNVPLTRVQIMTRKWSCDHFDMAVADEFYRFRLTPHDSRSMYRTIAAREADIPQRSTPDENFTNWFITQARPHSDPSIHAACMHYQPSPDAENPTRRFELIIVTPEMREATWKYGHNRQILMDLTFGVCSARVLLIVIMALSVITVKKK